MTARFIFHLWITCLIWGFVDTSGYVEVRLISYRNKNGTDSAGRCCDNKAPPGCGPCDPYLQIYLSQGVSSANLSNVVITRVYNDTNNITFGNSIGNINNPFKLTFANFSNKIELTIVAWDDDNVDVPKASNAKLEELKFKVGQGEPSSFYSSPNFVQKQINGKAVVLEFEYLISCSQYFYGGTCETYCKPKLSQYNCSKTGTKVCESGWSGPDCSTGICQNNKCENNATCKADLVIGGYKCSCKPNFSGQFCNTSTLPVTKKISTQQTAISTMPPNNNSVHQEPGSNSSTMLGVIIGSVLAVILIVTLLILITRMFIRKKHRNKTGNTLNNT